MSRFPRRDTSYGCRYASIVCTGRASWVPPSFFQDQSKIWLHSFSRSSSADLERNHSLVVQKHSPHVLEASGVAADVIVKVSQPYPGSADPRDLYAWFDACKQLTTHCEIARDGDVGEHAPTAALATTLVAGSIKKPDYSSRPVSCEDEEVFHRYWIPYRNGLLIKQRTYDWTLRLMRTRDQYTLLATEDAFLSRPAVEGALDRTA